MADFHFMHPAWFWLLLLIPVVWLGLFFMKSQQGRWEQIIDKHLMPFMLSGKRNENGMMLASIASVVLLLLTVAIAGPTWEKREVPVFRNQAALVVALDFSNSMYAQDEKPDRLTVARYKLLDILHGREDGQTGLVVFAGDAFMVSPLTTDINNIEEQVKNLSPDIMPSMGSQITPAIQRSAELLKQAGITRGNILLITDGTKDVDTAKAAAKLAAQDGYTVSVLAVGTKEGAPIPLPHGGTLIDGLGRTVTATTDLAGMEEIANAGGGVYKHASVGDEDISSLSALWKTDADPHTSSATQGRQVDTWVNEGYWLILPLLPLAAFAFRRGWIAVFLAVLLLPPPQEAQAASSRENALNALGEAAKQLFPSDMTWEDWWQTRDQQAAQALNEGNAAQASKLFTDQNWKAAADYQNKDYANAAKQYANSNTADGFYNYGNALAKSSKYQEALEAYDKALNLKPDFEDAKYNRDVVKKELDKQKQNQQNQPQNQSQKQDQSKQNQQDKQNQQNQSGQQQDDKQKQEQQQKEQQQKEAAEKARQEAEKKQQEEQQRKQEEAKKAQEQNVKNDPNQPEQKQDKEKQSPEEAKPETPQDKEQQQAAEQWMRRIPDDPAGLWRRKFQYQYQQRGSQSRGEEW